MTPNTIVPENVSTTNQKWTVQSRINFLKGAHLRNANSITAWQALFLSNVMDMTAEEQAQVPVDDLRKQLQKVKDEFNALSKLLNQTTQLVNAQTK